jgi:DNA repair exonuclease SbcCD ATPase subunit
MLRYDRSPATSSKPSLDERDTDYFDYFEGGSQSLPHSHTHSQSQKEQPLDASFSSGTSGISGFNHSASSSKAVLAALRALQDKIRRLETERSSALDEAAQLRSQLKSQEIEAEHSKEKDILHSQKSLQEARMAYERVITEKEDLEKSLKMVRTQNDQTQAHVQELRESNKELEAMRSSAEQRLAEVEGHLAKFEAEVERSKHRESGTKRIVVSLIDFVCLNFTKMILLCVQTFLMPWFGKQSVTKKR